MDLFAWRDATKVKNHCAVPVTFIIDLDENLWIADRHSEHVACAGGRDVLAAGELVFQFEKDQVEIIDVSNQSTGYCPEPECWDIVGPVLDRLQIDHPKHFSAAFTFRRCESCRAINIVKEGVFECAICGHALNEKWNF